MNRIFRTLSAVLLTTFALAALTQPSNAASGESGSFNITGVATLNGKPLSGVTAHLMQSWSEGDFYGHLHNATTNSKGSYSFSRLPFSKDGDEYDYVVVFTDSAKRIVATNRNLTPKNGKTVTRNVTLKAAAKITGTLIRADGTSPHNIRVLLDGDPERSEDGLEAYNAPTRVHVHTNGTYEFVGVAPGSRHSVEFIDESGKYADLCYDNVSCLTGPTRIVAVGGQTTSLNPQTMSVLPNHISGTVKDADGNVLKDIDVVAVPSNGDGPDGETWSSTTDSSGAFDIGNLAAGEWKLRIYSTVWQPQWYDGKSNEADATLVSVGPGDVSGLTITALSQSTLDVTATPGHGFATFQVHVIRKAGGPDAAGSVTINQGHKTITGDLVAGRATITLANLTPGKRTITVTYSGNSSTAGTSKTVVVMVKS